MGMLIAVLFPLPNFVNEIVGITVMLSAGRGIVHSHCWSNMGQQPMGLVLLETALHLESTLRVRYIQFMNDKQVQIFVFSVLSKDVT